MRPSTYRPPPLLPLLFLPETEPVVALETASISTGLLLALFFAFRSVSLSSSFKKDWPG